MLRNDFLKKNTPFILINLIVWGTYLLLTWHIGILAYPDDKVAVDRELNVFLNFITGIFISLILGFLYSKIKLIRKNIAGQITIAVIASFVFAYLWLLLYRESLGWAGSKCYFNFPNSRTYVIDNRITKDHPNNSSIVIKNN